ncbi:transcriptional repressor [Ktedonobacter sp. SOSP1-85]|uniref:Fur family transcriptional regulator n=1 Tax=Ktedonobacter sp. SOSP1-85 TaxID=2778367 RepID=UPI00191634EB|nr:Fur family transcriptional regulator [Ktedonobacter sp. SOSP1-85]GHO74425.1 transcriptional repressor [Ktedonobacter sp. SOSP1-85]
MHHYVRMGNELLRKRGYRLTPQRHMILSVIQDADAHLRVEEIAQRVQERNPYVSLSTIYRTLELLQKLGLIRSAHLPGGQLYYEAVQDHIHHHHLVCRQCQHTIHLDTALLGDLHEKLAHMYGFHEVTLDLLASGYCDACLKQLTQEEQHPQSQL